MTHLFASEVELVRTFCDQVTGTRRNAWTAYHETADWDVLLVHTSGIQVGIEAKLGLNAKVLDQALPGRWISTTGPDYRAVLVPEDACQLHLERIAAHLGITIIKARTGNHYPRLPDEAGRIGADDWQNWCPARRCPLPDYVPDVVGGHSSPVQLSPWKIKAIRLLILLERQGSVSRADIKALGLSPTRWTAAYHGFLARDCVGYVRCPLTPDLKAQHPTAWAQIEADFVKWAPVPAVLEAAA